MSASAVEILDTMPASAASSILTAPDRSRPATPDAVLWIEDNGQSPLPSPQTADGRTTVASHSPSSEASVAPVSRIARRSGAKVIVSHSSMPATSFDRDCSSSYIAPSDQELKEISELEQLEADHEISYSKTMSVQAPRALLWRALIKKIRHPELFTHAKKITILAEGIDYVFRELLVVPPGGCNGQTSITVREKVTWDETNENVRFTLYEDEAKEGYIENSVSLDASAQVCLTVSCNWTFHPAPALTSEVLATWRTQLMAALDCGCMKTVRVVEEEARQLLIERRRRHSVSLEVDANKQLQMLSLKDSRAATTGSAYATSSTTPRTSVSRPQSPGEVKPKQLNVAPKPESKEQQ